MRKPRIKKIGAATHPWVCWWNSGYGFKCSFASFQEAVWYASEIKGAR